MTPSRSRLVDKLCVEVVISASPLRSSGIEGEIDVVGRECVREKESPEALANLGPRVRCMGAGPSESRNASRPLPALLGAETS